MTGHVAFRLVARADPRRRHCPGRVRQRGRLYRTAWPAPARRSRRRATTGRASAGTRAAATTTRTRPGLRPRTWLAGPPAGAPARHGRLLRDLPARRHDRAERHTTRSSSRRRTGSRSRSTPRTGRSSGSGRRPAIPTGPARRRSRRRRRSPIPAGSGSTPRRRTGGSRSSRSRPDTRPGAARSRSCRRARRSRRRSTSRTATSSRRPAATSATQPPYQGHVVVIAAGNGRLLHVWNSLCSNVRHLLVPSKCWRERLGHLGPRRRGRRPRQRQASRGHGQRAVERPYELGRRGARPLVEGEARRQLHADEHASS